MPNLVKGGNCYVSLEEATAYFENRLDVAAWEEAGADNQQKALITATGVLDQLAWEGYISDVTQVLAFPRVVSYFDPRLGRRVCSNGLTIPDKLLIATYELAYHFLNNDGILDSTGSVTDLQLGNITLKEVSNPALIPATVRRIIRPLLINQGSLPVWRAW